MRGRESMAGRRIPAARFFLHPMDIRFCENEISEVAGQPLGRAVTARTGGGSERLWWPEPGRPRAPPRRPHRRDESARVPVHSRTCNPHPETLPMPLLTTTIGAYPKPEYVRLPDWFRHPQGPDATNPTQGWAEAMAALGRRCGSDHRAGRGRSDRRSDPRRHRHPHRWRDRPRGLHPLPLPAPRRRELRSTRGEGVAQRHLPRLAADHRRAGAGRRPLPPRRLPARTGVHGPAGQDHDARPDDHLGHHRGRALRRCADPGARSGRGPQWGGARPRRRRVPAHPDRRAAVRAQARARRSTTGSRTWSARVPRLPGARRAHGPHVLRLPRPPRPHGTIPRPTPDSYFRLADAIEDSAIDAISIEDAHRPNDLSLLERFRTTTVILGGGRDCQEPGGGHRRDRRAPRRGPGPHRRAPG